ncbi:hypothetical protein AVEN_73652-1 [Araneus ventricosus]|uniref:Uncharacterized protein n=1 Tax=Araneus ventricosus TaxID=182803 RepID=A0A4Y2HQ40_ARAVE|nr:hypothetical protein AVEN_73652-1 [Araneus ventricosus]
MLKICHLSVEPAISFSWNFRMITEEDEIDETEGLNYETEKIISLAEGTAAVDVALRYIEQKPDALPHNVLFLKRDTTQQERDFLLKNKQI